MIRLAPIGAVLLLALFPAYAADRPSAAALLDEVRRTFTVEGKPIPPEIFRDLGNGDLADSGPILVSVDVAAAVDRNLYGDPIGRDERWISQKKADGSEWVGYRFVGTTPSGLVVTVAAFSGGGTGVFVTLHILDSAVTRAFTSEGAVYERVTLTDVRAVALGDRWDGELMLAGETITVRTERGGPTDDGAHPTIRTIEARRP